MKKKKQSLLCLEVFYKVTLIAQVRGDEELS